MNFRKATTGHDQPEFYQLKAERTITSNGHCVAFACLFFIIACSGGAYGAQVSGKGEIFTIPFALPNYGDGQRMQLATRPDVTTLIVYPINPADATGFTFPQIEVGQISPGGQLQGPFQSVPTDFVDTFKVRHPAIAVNATGGVIVYGELTDFGGGLPRAGGIAFRLLDATSNPKGSEVGIASWIANQAMFVVPRVAMNSAGQFAIVWPNLEQFSVGLGSEDDIQLRAQILNSNGQPTSNISSNTFTVSQRPGASIATVAIASDGTCVFAWRYNSEEDHFAIYARRFDSAGNALGNEFQVNTTPGRGNTIALDNDLSIPEIAMAANGSFAIAWPQSYAQTSVYLQRFNSSGLPLGPEIGVATGFTYQSKLAMAADGRMVVV